MLYKVGNAEILLACDGLEQMYSKLLHFWQLISRGRGGAGLSNLNVEEELKHSILEIEKKRSLLSVKQYLMDE